MAVKKILASDLERCIEQRLTVTETAKQLGCTKGAISRRFKQLGIAGTQDIVLRSAQELNDRKLNAMARLERITKSVEKELSYVESTMAKASGEERREWETKHIGYAGEVRKQLSLLREIAQTLYNVEEVEAFKKIILEEIGAVDEQIRKTILERIRQRRTTSGLSGFGQLGI